MRLITIRKGARSRGTPSLSVSLLAAILGVLCMVSSGCNDSGKQPAASTSSDETIVVLRHGEKPPGGLGQISCMGLNRALALPKVLIGRFGRANAIFAPNPAVQMRENSLSAKMYSYVRPLATIEPTAIELGLPVNTQLGFRDIAGLQSVVTAPDMRTAPSSSPGSTNTHMILPGRCCVPMGWIRPWCRDGRAMISRLCMCFTSDARRGHPGRR